MRIRRIDPPGHKNQRERERREEMLGVGPDARREEDPEESEAEKPHRRAAVSPPEQVERQEQHGSHERVEDESGRDDEDLAARRAERKKVPRVSGEAGDGQPADRLESRRGKYDRLPPRLPQRSLREENRRDGKKRRERGRGKNNSVLRTLLPPGSGSPEDRDEHRESRRRREVLLEPRGRPHEPARARGPLEKNETGTEGGKDEEESEVAGAERRRLAGREREEPRRHEGDDATRPDAREGADEAGARREHDRIERTLDRERCPEETEAAGHEPHSSRGMEVPEIDVRNLAEEGAPGGADDDALVIEAVDPPARRQEPHEKRAESGAERESEIAPPGRDGARRVRQAPQNTARRAYDPFRAGIASCDPDASTSSVFSGSFP